MDDYSDDDFDGLNDTALRELENNAIQFTQAQVQSQAQAQPFKQQNEHNSYSDFDLEDDYLDDTEVVNGLLDPVALATTTAAPNSNANIPTRQAAFGPGTSKPPIPHQADTQWPSFSRPQNTTQRPRYPAPQPVHNSQFERPPGPQGPQGASQASQLGGQPENVSASSHGIVSALQQRVRALEAELNSTRGEVSIIRSNSTKAQQDHTAEVLRLKKQNAEQEARNQRIVEAAVAAKENATTELQFLQRDMRDANTRNKRTDAGQAPRAGAGATHTATTPKKTNKTWGFADGFDEMDIVASPSKGRGKSKDAAFGTGSFGERTPTKNKRKRPAVESPVMALDIQQGEVGSSSAHVGGVDELLAGESSNAVVYAAPPSSALPFDLQTVAVAPHIINQLIPVAEQSIYTVAESRFKSVDGDISADAEANALQEQVDTTYILSILQLVAESSVTSVTNIDNMTQTRQSEFWCMIPLDLVLIFLTPNQRLSDVQGMLDLLCTSVLPASVGPLVAGKSPESVAYMVIEKVSSNLIDPPKAAKTPRQRYGVGLGVLHTLSSFAGSKFGALQIAKHVNAVPRLVATLSALVDELYDMSGPVLAIKKQAEADEDMTPQSPKESDNYDEAVSSLHQLIKRIVMLLHKLVTDPNTANKVDIQSKLSLAYGGSQRYILALSRIHFAEEDLVYEAGIDEQTAELARELCELAVTPDEGEDLREAFGV